MIVIFGRLERERELFGRRGRLFLGGAEQNSEKDFELHQPDYARIEIENIIGTFISENSNF